LSFEEKILLERLAELEHEQWAHWINYQLRVGVKNKEQWRRWHDLARIPYTNLSEKEKESDREWARKVLALLQDREQKLREFGELLKNRPETIFPPSSRTAWCNPEKSAKYFELLEKKFRELTK